MKTGLAISIKQPWAWLIVQGIKPVENRDWPTKIRGVVGIHAGKSIDLEGYDWIRSEFPDLKIPKPRAYLTGGIIGRAELIDCVRAHPSRWFFGKYGFVFTAAEPLPFEACRGMLGFFRPNLTRENGENVKQTTNSALVTEGAVCHGFT